MGKNFKALFYVCLLIFIYCHQGYGQQLNDTLPETIKGPPYPWSNKKEVALNVTNLAKLFIPLNFTSVTTQEVILKTKWYFKKVALRVDFGSDIKIDDNTSINSLYLAVGYERRRAIYKNKWLYTTGWSGVFKGNDNDGAFLGILKHFGMEYNIHPSVTLGTDTGLLFGNFADEFNLRLLPPTSLYLQMRF